MKLLDRCFDPIERPVPGETQHSIQTNLFLLLQATRHRAMREVFRPPAFHMFSCRIFFGIRTPINRICLCFGVQNSTQAHMFVLSAFFQSSAGIQVA